MTLNKLTKYLGIGLFYTLMTKFKFCQFQTNNNG